MSKLDEMPVFGNQANSGQTGSPKTDDKKDAKLTRGQYEYVDPATGIIDFFETPEELKEAIAAGRDRDNRP